jgi:ligand-binding sensor domain-containing protein/signal transduction histidine kinase
MRRTTLIIAVLCLISLRWAHASDRIDPYFESVGDAESIPDNNVSALTQDRIGFLWIGTPDGLLRYDGYRFRKFAGDVVGAESLAGNFVRSLLTAKDGRVWIGTNADGVVALDPVGGHFQRYQAQAGSDQGLSNNTVRALAEDALGGIYIGTREGLDYAPGGGLQVIHQRQRLGPDTSVDDEQITALLVASNNDLWIGSWGRLSIRRATDGRYQEVSAKFAADPRPIVQVQSLLQLDTGVIVVGTARDGSFAVSPDGADVRRIPANEPAVTSGAMQPAVLSMLQPRPGVLWLGVFGGIDVLDAASFELLQQVRPDPAVASSLAHDQIRAMLLDQSGQIWIGGYGGGLQRHDPGNDAIHVLRHSPTRPDSLSMASVSSVLERENGQIWVGTRGNGIDVWDRTQGVVAGFRPDAATAGALRNGVVSSLAQTADGLIWVGTVDGLQRYDPVLDAFEWLGPEHGLRDAYVRRLLAGKDGELWIGSDAGLARRSPGQALIEHISGPDGSPLREDVNALIEAPDGRLWVGSSTGLRTLESGGHALAPVHIHASDGAAMEEVGILGLLLDHRGQLWADTPVGLNRMTAFDGETAVFEAVKVGPVALGHPFGANLLEDASGRIWSQRYVYDPQQRSLYELGRADGADLGTPWFRSYAKTRDGQLLFGGSNGLMVVDPVRFRRWQYQPPVVATELRLGGELRVVESLAAGFEITPEQRGFALEFAALDFTAPQRNRYQYRLTGYDRDWIDTDSSRRVASYNSLAPGDYEVQVRGSARTGIIGGQTLSIPVHVIPAFWQTWWFKLLVLAMSAALLVLAIRLRDLGMRRRAQVLEATVGQRTAELTQAKERAERALVQLQSAQAELVAREKMASLGQLVAGVAHEINTPVGVALTASSYLSERSDALRRALESGQLQRSELAGFIAQTHEASTMIGQNLARASDLVRSFKQVSVDRSSDDRRHFQLDDNLRAVVRSLEITWKRRPISLVLECVEGIELDSYPGALGQVVSNLIQNALLHAFDPASTGTMRLSAALSSADRIAIVFEDDGVGIAKSDLDRVFEPFFTTRRAMGGSGLGLHIVFNLVTAKLGGQISAEGTPGAGMRFVLSIPRVAP